MSRFNRRAFLSASGASPLIIGATNAKPTATLVVDGNDPIASARPVLKAVHTLQMALTQAGYSVRRAQSLQQAAGLCFFVASSGFAGVAGLLRMAHVVAPTAPESLALFEAGQNVIVACGADIRGLIYAVHELADRAAHGVPLKFPQAVVEQPANAVRSVMRPFTSELYDKPWFYDRAQWPQYFAMLVANRFNRINFTLGLGYDMLSKVADPYLVFAYPFLMAVPGYDVRVTGLADTERDRNLAMLRYISDEAVAHGLQFELGLWMHGYEMKDTPDPKYAVTGLGPDNHGAYCRDALTALLKALPAVSSVGLRIHGESGVAEGSYGFWKGVFHGAAACGRKVELDLHAKGIDKPMLADALGTGLPINVSPKLAAEHIGLPYHQADIRPSEIPAAGATGKGLMALSEGQRSFTRYGNADLLRDDRPYTVRTRVFYGTQRILASGGAEAGAAYGRAFQFCGMTGFDLLEPLTYRGRRGSAVPGARRSGYLPTRLEPHYDWQKYDYWYRSFGRMGFNPDAEPQSVKRSFGTKPEGRALEAALAAASRILPLVVNAHSESAACDLYWPEIGWNLPFMGEVEKFFWDTPSPRNFQNVTALDPQLFTSCREYADELLGTRSGKYSPMEAAHWLTAFAKTAEDQLARAKPVDIDSARLRIDIEMQIWLGRFFAEKLIAGVFFTLHEKTGDKAALAAATGHYEEARGCWQHCVARADGVYAEDLSISDRFTERGAWGQRLKDIDADLAAVKAKRDAAPETSDARVAALLASQSWNRAREPLAASHMPPANFAPGQPVELQIAAPGVPTATLWYRHVNQAERWVAVAMTAIAEGWQATIPAAYTDTAYPLQYYFEFRSSPDKAWLSPGFDKDLLNQPYHVLQRG